jgi:aminoglycoside 3-N-acetyltransferase
MLTLEDFKRQFAKVLAPEDEVVVVYSGIWTFGHRFQLPPEKVAGAILDAIEEVVGPDRTLLFPTYTYSYNRERKFDILSTKPETGVLTELFLKRPGVRRTKSAISSFAARGPLAKEAASLKGESIWGEGSLIEWIEKRDARIVTLGLPWKLSCGFLHRIEEAAQVPYRYHKDFPGEYRDADGTVSAWSERMYVRPLHVPCRFDWSLVDQLARQRGQIRSGSVAGVMIESCSAKDLVRAGLDLVEKDPFALVTNRAEVEDWVRNGGKDRELEELRSGSQKNDFTYKTK